MKPSIAFFGTPNFSVPILKSLQNNFRISVVVSQPAKPVGKGLRPTPSPVSDYAISQNIPLLTPASLKDPQFKQQLVQHHVDVAVVVAYGNILPRWLLEWPGHGAINIHASLLPKYRGASPIAAAILDNQPVTGLTLIQMNTKMDEGDILAKTELAIDPDDTTISLSQKLSDLAARWSPKVIHQHIEGKITPTPQDHANATYCSHIQKADGYFALDSPPDNLSAMVRAYYPWPGTWTEFRNKRVKLLPGGHIQMEGKKPTDLESFLRGYPDFPLREW